MFRITTLFFLVTLIFSCANTDTFSAVDVYTNFTNKGFSLERNDGSNWICKNSSSISDMIVEISGNGPNDIRLIKGTYLSFTDTNIEGKQFLSYLASVQYPGSTPNQAKDWVISNWGSNSEKSFGPANYSLICNEHNSMLIITFNK